MAPRKTLASGVKAGPVAVAVSQPLISNRKVPALLRFPLLVLLNLSLSALFYSLASGVTAGDLSTVSRSINDWWEVAGLLAWKASELAAGWWGQYDGYDLAALTLISHLPPVYLLTSFYGIRPTTLLASLSIDILATYIPFRLLRPILATHATDAPRGAISNRSIISDLPVQIFTSALGASVYAAVLYSSYLTWLPSHLAVHFDGLRDISAAYAGQFPKLCLTFVPVGIATKVFLFTPSTGAKADLGDIKNTAFNPATATLGETVYQNFWGYSKRTRTLIKRTLTLAAVSYLNTWLQVSVTVEGTESQGAAGWACVWATAAIITGFAYLWVGNIEEVTN